MLSRLDFSLFTSLQSIQALIIIFHIFLTQMSNPHASKCRIKRHSHRKRIKIDGWKYVDHGKELNLRHAVATYGPIAVALDAMSIDFLVSFQTISSSFLTMSSSFQTTSSSFQIILIIIKALKTHEYANFRATPPPIQDGRRRRRTH